MYNAHNICDSFYKETEYKTQVLNLLKDENLKDRVKFFAIFETSKISKNPTKHIQLKVTSDYM